MTVQLTTFNDGKNTYLAVGRINDKGAGCAHDELRYYAARADGEEFWTDSYAEALEFISEGLDKPRHTYTL